MPLSVLVARPICPSDDFTIKAADIFQRMMTSADFTEFLALEAYDYIE
jgi:hypothetical protein